MAENTNPYSQLAPVREGLFEYYDVSAKFEVSINMIDAGSELEEHTHEVDVFNYVMEGEFIVRRSGGESCHVRGDWISIPANQPHSVLAQSRVTLLELWKKSAIADVP